jgi:hypothetical protein
MKNNLFLAIILAVIHFILSWLDLFKFDWIYFVIPMIFGIVLAGKEVVIDYIKYTNILILCLVYGLLSSVFVEINIYRFGAPLNGHDFITSVLLLVALSYIGGLLYVLIKGASTKLK